MHHVSEPQDSEVLQQWGRALQARRQELGLSRAALAEACGVKPATVWRWEKGWYEPGWSNKEALSAALGVNVTSLYGVAS